MALNDVFEPDQKCSDCGKNLNDVIKGKDFCRPCTENGERRIAQRSVLRHLGDALVCLFHFRFFGVFAEVIWAIERLFKIGDYNPVKGKFYKRGYLK